MSKGALQVKKKKVNPRRHIVTEYDIQKFMREAEASSVKAAWAIMFSVMRDKYDWSPEQLQGLWGHVESYADSVNKGYIKIDDIMRVLSEEDNIILE